MMFMSYYNMSKNPFVKGIASGDVHPTEDLKRIHARLDHLARTGGIGLITANPGTGKTVAVRTWADKLNPNKTKLVYLCMSAVTNVDFYRQLAYGLGIEPAFRKSDLFRDIQECIRTLAEERKVRVVVVIDEAHLLHFSVLRDLQMLTNFDMDSKDLLAVVLVGRSVLSQYLQRHHYESLRQRLVVSYRMEGLEEQGVRDYIHDALCRAGADPDLFDDAALASAHSVCAGSIRRLNSIIVNALSIGAQNNARHIDAEMVRSAAAELSLT